MVKPPLCVFAVDPLRPWENPCRNSSTSACPSARRLLAFPRQSHRGAVCLDRQKHSRPWTVFAVICGRCSQIGRCGCFQSCFVPFSVREGLGRTRESVVRTTTRLVRITSLNRIQGQRRSRRALNRISDFGSRASFELRTSTFGFRPSRRRPAGKDSICTKIRPSKASSNGARRADHGFYHPHRRFW